MQEIFFDSHMHAMNLNHPNFISLVESLSDGFADFVTSGALSPGYLLTPANRGLQGLTTILNMFSVFERPIGEIFAMMEDDLAGMYARPVVDGKKSSNVMYPAVPYIRDGKFYFRERVYEKLGLGVLVMDFSRDHGEWGKSYYTSEQQTKILGYIADTIEGMDWYNSMRPEGLLQFYPFLGINPQVHGFEFVQELFDRYVCTAKSARYGKSSKHGKRFKGIKLYPPLGMNPWPESGVERDKVEFIYGFCQENQLPVITHCDDQGFRGVPAKLAQQYTAPRSWRPVLERYPDLKIDFAHYGRQYNVLARHSPINVLLENNFTKDPWFLDIIALMRDYQHVYADCSFSGTDPKFYEHLQAFMETGKRDAQLVLDRSLFGSDFTVNLAKVESYMNYYRIFETSPLTDEVVHAFASINAKKFLGL